MSAKKKTILISAIVLMIVLAVAVPVFAVAANGSTAETCPGLQVRAQNGTCDGAGNCYGDRECDQTRDRDRDGTCDGDGSGHCYGSGTCGGDGICDGTGKGALAADRPGSGGGGCWRR